MTLALEGSFTEAPTDEIIRFRSFLFKALKQAFCVDLKPTADTEKVQKILIFLILNYKLNYIFFFSKYLSLLNFFLAKTKSIKVIEEEAKISFCSILILLGNESNSLKSKALQVFTIFMKQSKSTQEIQHEDQTSQTEK